MIIIKSISPRSINNKLAAKSNKTELPKLKFDTCEINPLNRKRKAVSFCANRIGELHLLPEPLEKIYNASAKISNQDSNELKADILNRLIANIPSNNSPLSQASIKALGGIGASDKDKAVQVTRELTTANQGFYDNDPDVQKASIEALAKIASAFDDQAVEIANNHLIAQGINNINPDAKQASIEALGEIGSVTRNQQLKDSVYTALTAPNRGFNDISLAIKESSINALGLIGAAHDDKSQQIFNLLTTQGINSPNAPIREASAEALGKIGAAHSDLSQQAASILIIQGQGIDDADQDVRKLSSIALGKIGAANPTLVQQILTALSPQPNQPALGIDDVSVTVRLAAVRAFNDIASNVADSDVQRNILMILDGNGRGINDNSPFVRRGSAAAMGNIGVSSSDGQLQTSIVNTLNIIGKGLKDNDINLGARKHSATALGKIGVAHPRLAEQIINVLNSPNFGINDNANHEVRANSAKALGMIGFATRDQVLETNIVNNILNANNIGINDVNSGVNAASAEALGMIGNSTVDQQLQNVIFNILTAPNKGIHHASTNVRSSSAKALGKINIATDNQAQQFVDALTLNNQGIHNPDTNVQRAAVKSLGKIAGKKGYLNSNELLSNGRRKTIFRKVMEELTPIEQDTQNRGVYTQAVVSRKELEEKDGFLQSLKAFALVPILGVPRKGMNLLRRIVGVDVNTSVLRDLSNAEREDVRRGLDELVAQGSLNKDRQEDRFVPDYSLDAPLNISKLLGHRASSAFPSELAEAIYRKAKSEEK